MTFMFLNSSIHKLRNNKSLPRLQPLPPYQVNKEIWWLKSLRTSNLPIKQKIREHVLEKKMLKFEK